MGSAGLSGLRDLIEDEVGKGSARERVVVPHYPENSHVAQMMTIVREIVRSAWDVCDDTGVRGEGEDVLVSYQSWDELQEAVSALEALIPEKDQPAQAGHAVTLLMRELNIKPSSI